MLSAAGLLSALRERTPQMLRDIEELVNIDSGSYCAEGVTRVARWLGDRLSGLGFKTRYDQTAERGDRLTAIRRLGGRGRLMVLGHSDTVWPAGTVAEWPFEVRGDVASGPGVGDMKSALVMALHALELLLAQGPAGLESVRVLLVSDEELGSPQSRAWIEEHARNSDWVLVLEPARPGGGLVTSRGAVGALSIEARGVSAHTARDYARGASAIRELAALVGPLEALSAPDRGVIVNVGLFQGGAARQVVPDRASMHVDLRAKSAEDAARLDERLAAIFGRRQDSRVELRISGGWTRPVFPRTDGTAELFHKARRIAESLGLPAFELPMVSAGSDGSFCGALGIPTLDGMGPISHDTCSRQETVEISSIAERGAILAGLVADLAGELQVPTI